MEPRQISDHVWEIPREGGMLVPGRIFASQELIEAVLTDRAGDQVANVAHLPGIVEASYAMPDIHWGYGFPIGGVAATRTSDGVVSPGGVGFDICCGVRLLASQLDESEFGSHREHIMAELDRRIPRGVGKGAIAPGGLVNEVIRRGAAAAFDAGYGWEGDLERGARDFPRCRPNGRQRQGGQERRGPARIARCRQSLSRGAGGRCGP